MDNVKQLDAHWGQPSVWWGGDYKTIKYMNQRENKTSFKKGHKPIKGAFGI